VSEHIRIGLGVLAAAWFGPVLAWAFLAARSDLHADTPSTLFLVHRTLPALMLLVAAVIGSWPLAAVAFVSAAVTTLTVEFFKCRWPERWDKMGQTGS
jgi:hypothetical protein